MVVSSWIRYQRKILTTDGGRCGNIRACNLLYVFLTILGLKLCPAGQVVVLLTTTLLVWNSYAFVDFASRRLMVRVTQIPFPSPEKPSSSYQSTGLQGSPPFSPGTNRQAQQQLRQCDVSHGWIFFLHRECGKHGESWTVRSLTVKKI